MKVDAAVKAGEAKAVVDATKSSGDQAVADQKAKEAGWAATLPVGPDGLQHWPDGRNWYVPDKQQVGGVNHYAQKASK